MQEGGERVHDLAARRHQARLAAVQALYQMELSGRGASAVVREFLRHRLVEDGRADALDAAFFEALVEGVAEVQADVDARVSSVLAANWRLERLDATVRALLRAAAFELAHRADVPARAAIDAYVSLTQDFFEGPETAFVNGALDSLARAARPDELTARQGDG